jgi:hypothetical protein
MEAIRKTSTKLEYRDDQGDLIGEAIETPAGIMVWGQDYEAEADPNLFYLPIYLATFTQWAYATEAIDRHERENRS